MFQPPIARSNNPESFRPSRLRRIARVGATAALAAALSVVLVPGASATSTASPATGLYYQPAFASASSDGAVSGDWAGYDLTGSTYTSVGASWTQPTVTCATGETSYSADWVGLDGDGSESVEQIGASADCDEGTPVYSAWYEFYPADSVTLPQTVKAGDKLTATVKSATDGSYTLTLVDHTGGWTKTVTGSAPDAQNASAEIIAEAPSSSARQGSVLPLADFKTVAFTGVTVNGQTLTSSSGARKITMGDETGATMASASALTSGDFGVTWASSGSDASTATGRSGRGVTPGSGWVPGSSTGSGSTGDSTGSGSTGTGSTGSGSTGDGSGSGSQPRRADRADGLRLSHLGEQGRQQATLPHEADDR